VCARARGKERRGEGTVSLGGINMFMLAIRQCAVCEEQQLILEYYLAKLHAQDLKL
jgi:hypothetical protein